MTSPSDPESSWQNKAAIAIQTGTHGILLGVPFVGPSLAHFIFAPLAELRMQRIERTLSEVAAALGERAAETAMVNERFTTVLEAVVPALSRSIEEEKRARFRDLLTNSASPSTESAHWEDAILAARLVSEIEAPGLAIVAALAKIPSGEPATLASLPAPQLFRGRFDYDNPGEVQQALHFSWPAIDYWARTLREKRVVSFISHDARGGFGGVVLETLGEFLVKWTIR